MKNLPFTKRDILIYIGLSIVVLGIASQIHLGPATYKPPTPTYAVTQSTPNPIHTLVKEGTFFVFDPGTFAHIDPNDMVGINQLIARGTLVVLKGGTSVRLLDTQSDYHKVRVTSDGPYKDVLGYIKYYGMNQANTP